MAIGFKMLNRTHWICSVKSNSNPRTHILTFWFGSNDFITRLYWKTFICKYIIFRTELKYSQTQMKKVCTCHRISEDSSKDVSHAWKRARNASMTNIWESRFPADWSRYFEPMCAWQQYSNSNKRDSPSAVKIKHWALCNTISCCTSDVDSSLFKALQTYKGKGRDMAELNAMVASTVMFLTEGYFSNLDQDDGHYSTRQLIIQRIW